MHTHIRGVVPVCRSLTTPPPDCDCGKVLSFREGAAPPAGKGRKSQSVWRLDETQNLVNKKKQMSEGVKNILSNVRHEMQTLVCITIKEGTAAETFCESYWAQSYKDYPLRKPFCIAEHSGHLTYQCRLIWCFQAWAVPFYGVFWNCFHDMASCLVTLWEYFIVLPHLNCESKTLCKDLPTSLIISEQNLPWMAICLRKTKQQIHFFLHAMNI